VIPPQAQFGPKWIFGKGDDGANVLWNRESLDVMMIQNKMKIDSISTVAAGAAAPVQDDRAIVFKPNMTGGNLPAFADPLQNPFGTGAPPVDPGPGSFGMSNANAHGWMPQAKEQVVEKVAPALPPPVELDPANILATLHALGNSDTGMMDFAPFTYFLLREFHHCQKTGGKMSIVMFEFRDKDSFEVIDLPPEALEVVAKQVNLHCTNFALPSRLPTGEFVILLASTSSAEAMKFADALWKDLSQDFLACFGEDPRSLAMGVSNIPDQCRDPGVMLSTAQIAKEQARKAGRSHLLFSTV
jgi:GGDEF domain-containing protein